MNYDSILKIDFSGAFSAFSILIFFILIAYFFRILSRTNQSVKQNTYQFLSLLISSGIGSILLLHTGVAQALDIGSPVVSPAALTENTSTNVYVSAIMNDTNVINANVQLIKEGKVSVIGSLNDSGSDGDALAKDGVFSGHLQIQVGLVGHIELRVSAALKGALKRTLSPVVSVDILPVGAPLSSVVPNINNVSFYPGTTEKIVADEVLACFNPSVSYKEVVSIGVNIQGTVIGRFSEIGNCYQFQLPSGADGSDVSAAITTLLLNPHVASAEPDDIISGADSCSTPTCNFNVQNYSNQLNLDTVHDNFGKGKGIIIGIVDSGVSMDPITTTGVGLLPKWVIGPDFTLPGPWIPGTALDEHGHGTNIASIIKATAPDSNLYINRALDKNNNGTASSIYKAIIDAGVSGAKVVNLSITGYIINDKVAQVTQDLLNKHIVVVAAAGNASIDTNRTPAYPASYDGVLGVGNVDANDKIYNNSNFGPAAKIAAPGVGICGYSIGGGVRCWTGTSQATPFVTGVVALLKAKYPDIDSVQQILKTALPIPKTLGSDNCPNQPCNQDLGKGRLAPLAAMGALRITRSTAINAGAIQSTTVTITSGSTPVYQTIIQTSGQSQGCQNINNIKPTCIVDIPFDFSRLSAGKHEIKLETKDPVASFFGGLKLNAPGVTFDSVKSGNGSIDTNDKLRQSAFCSLFGFGALSGKSAIFVINKK